MNKIALSSALSWDHNWDPKYSVDIIKKTEITSCQIYIGDNFIDDKELGDSIAADCKDSIDLIAHSPVDLTERALDTALISSIDHLLKNNKKLVVYHHDYTYPLSNTLRIVKELNSRGITVLLENFYISREREEVLKNIKSYISILKECKSEGLSLYPLLDIPRLFIDGIVDSIDSIGETLNLFDEISRLNYPLYLHLIDCSDSSQARHCWCPVGMGCIPYEKIFKRIKDLNLDIPLIVLEYEELKHVDKSLDYLRDI